MPATAMGVVLTSQANTFRTYVRATRDSLSSSTTWRPSQSQLHVMGCFQASDRDRTGARALHQTCATWALVVRTVSTRKSTRRAPSGTSATSRTMSTGWEVRRGSEDTSVGNATGCSTATKRLEVSQLSITSEPSSVANKFSYR